MNALRALREKGNSTPEQAVGLPPEDVVFHSPAMSKGLLGWDTLGAPDPGVFDTLGGRDPGVFDTLGGRDPGVFDTLGGRDPGVFDTLGGPDPGRQAGTTDHYVVGRAVHRVPEAR
jgi:hypothetical protein